jgi:hypothetical protein
LERIGEIVAPNQYKIIGCSNNGSRRRPGDFEDIHSLSFATHVRDITDMLDTATESDFKTRKLLELLSKYSNPDRVGPEFQSYWAERLSSLIKSGKSVYVAQSATKAQRNFLDHL